MVVRVAWIWQRTSFKVYRPGSGDVGSSVFGAVRKIAFLSSACSSTHTAISLRGSSEVAKILLSTEYLILYYYAEVTSLVLSCSPTSKESRGGRYLPAVASGSSPVSASWHSDLSFNFILHLKAHGAVFGLCCYLSQSDPARSIPLRRAQSTSLRQYLYLTHIILIF